MCVRLSKYIIMSVFIFSCGKKQGGGGGAGYEYGGGFQRAGTVDTSFDNRDGIDGWANPRFVTQGPEVNRSIALQDDEKIVIAGSSKNTESAMFSFFGDNKKNNSKIIIARFLGVKYGYNPTPGAENIDLDGVLDNGRNKANGNGFGKKGFFSWEYPGFLEIEEDNTDLFVNKIIIEDKYYYLFGSYKNGTNVGALIVRVELDKKYGNIIDSSPIKIMKLENTAPIYNAAFFGEGDAKKIVTVGYKFNKDIKYTSTINVFDSKNLLSQDQSLTPNTSFSEFNVDSIALSNIKPQKENNSQYFYVGGFGKKQNGSSDLVIGKFKYDSNSISLSDKIENGFDNGLKFIDVGTEYFKDPKDTNNHQDNSNLPTNDFTMPGSVMDIDNQGNILLAGVTDLVLDGTHQNLKIVVAKVSKDGVLDTSFGIAPGGKAGISADGPKTGLVVISGYEETGLDSYGGDTLITSLKCAPDNKFIIAGSSTFAPPSTTIGSTISIARFNNDGSIDRSFGPVYAGSQAYGMNIVTFGGTIKHQPSDVAIDYKSNRIFMSVNLVTSLHRTDKGSVLIPGTPGSDYFDDNVFGKLDSSWVVGAFYYDSQQDNCKSQEEGGNVTCTSKFIR